MKNLWVILILILVVGGIWWFMTQNDEMPEAPFEQNGEEVIVEEELPSAVLAVRQFVAESVNLPEDRVAVLNFTETEWPDGCLGLAAEDEMCTQAIVPGFSVSIQIDGQVYNYRTDSEGNQIRRER